MDLTFSQRIGKTEVRDKFQTNNMDDKLRNALWNYIDRTILHESAKSSSGYYMTTNKGIISKISTNFFHSRYVEITYRNDKKYVDAYYDFCMKSDWFKVYDFLDFAVNCLSDFMPHKGKSRRYKAFEGINAILEEHMSGYRFVGGVLSPITDENEINSIEEATRNEDGSVQLHIKTALEFLSDKNNPDYRNSIKESISAVEALCRKLTKKNTLGEAIKVLESVGKIELDSQFRTGLNNIYNYTNDKKTGIRHALIEDDVKTPSFEDAKFMLVLCSAFINYIPTKFQDSTIGEEK